jgi:hypothetical protein
MTDPQPLRLVDRLRGIYHMPVNDGAGPLDGSMIFTREFKPLTPLHNEAANMIERLEAGGKPEWLEVNNLCMALIQPMDPLGTGKLYVVPILQEASQHIYTLRLAMEPKDS